MCVPAFYQPYEGGALGINVDATDGDRNTQKHTRDVKTHTKKITTFASHTTRHERARVQNVGSLAVCVCIATERRQRRADGNSTGTQHKLIVKVRPSTDRTGGFSHSGTQSGENPSSSSLIGRTRNRLHGVRAQLFLNGAFAKQRCGRKRRRHRRDGRRSTPPTPLPTHICLDWLAGALHTHGTRVAS